MSKTDLFTDANGTPITTHNPGMHLNAGDFDIQSNNLAANGATASTDCGVHNEEEVWSDDQRSAIILGAVSATINARIGAGVRMALDNSENYYGINYDEDAGEIFAFKKVAGVWTALGASFTGARVPGDELEVSMTADVLTVKDNGATLGTRTDSTFASGAPGVVGRGTTTNHSAASWTGESLGAVGAAALSGSGTTAGITDADYKAADKVIQFDLTDETFVPASVTPQIGYVGGMVGGRAGSTSTLAVNFALTGGEVGFADVTPQAGDYVVITVVIGTAARLPTCAIGTPAGYSAIGDLTADDTFDTRLNVSRKFMGATPDTQFTLPSTGNIADAQRYTVQVFRNVDPTTPMDVAPVSATGINTSRPDPASITPITAGAVVLICGGGAAGTGANYTAPANYATNFLTGFSADTNDAIVGSGYLAWTAGAENPAAYTGGSNTTSDSWASYTLALRPAPGTTPFADARQAMIDGGVSAGGETNGYNNAVRPNIVVADVVRVSNTQAQITVRAANVQGFSITAPETIEWMLPGSILTGGSPITATPTFVIANAPTGTTFFQNCGGAIVPAGSLTRRTSKPITAAIAPAGVLARRTSRTITAAVAPSGAIARQTRRPIAGSVAPAGALARSKVAIKNVGGVVVPAGTIEKRMSKPVAGGVVPAGTLVRQARRPIAAGLAPTGILTRRVNKAVAGLLAPTGTVLRRTGKLVGGSVGPTGVVSSLKVFVKNIGGAIVPGGVLSRKTFKLVGGGSAPTGTLSRRTFRQIGGQVAPAGDLKKRLARSIAAAIAPTGTLGQLKVFVKAIGGAIAPVGSLARTIQRGRILGGSIVPSGTLKRRTAKQLGGEIEATGSISRQLARKLDGQIAPAGTLRKGLSQQIAGVVGSSGTLQRLLGKNVGGEIAPTGELQTLFTQRLSEIYAKMVRAGSGIAARVRAFNLGAWVRTNSDNEEEL